MTKLWRYIFGGVGVILMGGMALGSASAQSCGAAADRAAVVQAVRTMFVAAAKDNITLFHSVASPDFYAFDNGRQFHGDELMALIQQLHAQGHVFVWKVTEPKVHLDCHMAWIAEINVGSVDGKPTRWLESGMLKKTDGKWRVQFFNSARAAETPLPPAPPK
ncbi:MAG: nuclear transport factor 2 family protein [Acidobacteriaceae bacterium]